MLLFSTKAVLFKDWLNKTEKTWEKTAFFTYAL